MLFSSSLSVVKANVTPRFLSNCSFFSQEYCSLYNTCLALPLRIKGNCENGVPNDNYKDCAC